MQRPAWASFPPVHYPSGDALHLALERTADRLPEHIAIRFGDDQYSFRDLDGLSNACARLLLERGVRTGNAGRDHVVQPARVRDRPLRRPEARVCAGHAEPGMEAVRGGVRARPHRSHTCDPRRRRSRVARTALRYDAARRSRRSRLPRRRRRPQRRATRAGRRLGEHGRRPRVQLRDHRLAEGGAPHPPIAGCRGRALALGAGADGQRQLPDHHTANACARAPQPGHGRRRRQRDGAPASTLRCRRDARLRRTRPHDVGDGGGAHRARHGTESRPRAPRPVVAALHRVGRHPDHRERRPAGDRAHRCALDARLRGERGSRDQPEPGASAGVVAARQRGHRRQRRGGPSRGSRLRAGASEWRGAASSR